MLESLKSRFSEFLPGFFSQPQAALFCIELKNESKKVEEIINAKTSEHVQEVRFMDVNAAIPYEEEIRTMEEQLSASPDRLLCTLNKNENARIIPVSLGTYSSGYVLAANEEQSLNQSFIWFTSPLSGYEKNKFYSLGAILNDYWSGMKLKETIFQSNDSASSPPIPS